VWWGGGGRRSQKKSLSRERLVAPSSAGSVPVLSWHIREANGTGVEGVLGTRPFFAFLYKTVSKRRPEAQVRARHATNVVPHTSARARTCGRLSCSTTRALPLRARCVRATSSLPLAAAPVLDCASGRGASSSVNGVACPHCSSAAGGREKANATVPMSASRSSGSAGQHDGSGKFLAQRRALPMLPPPPPPSASPTTGSSSGAASSSAAGVGGSAGTSSS